MWERGMGVNVCACLSHLPSGLLTELVKDRMRRGAGKKERMKGEQKVLDETGN